MISHPTAIILHCQNNKCFHKTIKGHGGLKIMDTAIIITPRTIERLCNMTEQERHLMLDTLCCDEILHIERREPLSPRDEMAYHFFRLNVMNESRRLTAMVNNSVPTTVQRAV